jgi:hypothetical protein
MTSACSGENVACPESPISTKASVQPTSKHPIHRRGMDLSENPDESQWSPLGAPHRPSAGQIGGLDFREIGGLTLHEL